MKLPSIELRSWHEKVQLTTWDDLTNWVKRKTKAGYGFEDVVVTDDSDFQGVPELEAHLIIEKKATYPNKNHIIFTLSLDYSEHALELLKAVMSNAVRLDMDIVPPLVVLDLKSFPDIKLPPRKPKPKPTNSNDMHLPF